MVYGVAVDVTGPDGRRGKNSTVRCENGKFWGNPENWANIGDQKCAANRTRVGESLRTKGRKSLEYKWRERWIGSRAPAGSIAPFLPENGYCVDVKGYCVDVKGYYVDVKGYCVDVKGY
eukprot:9482570-Pyramimonas_sp.AAC.1